MFVKFFGIDWDTDGEQVDLPQEVVLEVDDNFDVANDGADHGWCINSFVFEILPGKPDFFEGFLDTPGDPAGFNRWGPEFR